MTKEELKKKFKDGKQLFYKNDKIVYAGKFQFVFEFPDGELGIRYYFDARMHWVTEENG